MGGGGASEKFYELIAGKQEISAPEGYYAASSCSLTPLFFGDAFMKRLLSALVIMLMLALSAGMISAEDKKPSPIKKAMKVAMKEGLLKKVAKGEGTADDKEQLLKLVTAMAKAEPPKGELADWKTRAGALVEAAQAAVDGKDGAGEALTKASNCKECHSAHKPA